MAMKGGGFGGKSEEKVFLWLKNGKNKSEVGENPFFIPKTPFHFPKTLLLLPKAPTSEFSLAEGSRTEWEVNGKDGNGGLQKNHTSH